MRLGFLTAALATACAHSAWSQTPAAAQGAPADACQLRKIADLKLVEKNGEVFTTGSVNGITKLFALGGGSTFTNSKTAEAWGLKVAKGGVMTSAGSPRPVGFTVAPQFTVGDAFVYRNARLFVDLDKVEADPEVGGSLGAEILAEADVEYDLKNGRISIFSSEGCADRPMAYWSQNWAEVAFNEKTYDLMAKVGGRDVVTVLSLGGPHSHLRVTPAEKATYAMAAGGTTEALEPQFDLPASVVAYQSFEMGGEVIRNPKIVTVQTSNVVRMPSGSGRTTTSGLIRGGPDLILGADFFRAHRIFISNRQRKVYFTYNGGPVFSRPAAASALQ